ncbi:MAG: class III extradiol ring-cleavage dioxygenase, partial [Rhodospirillales bacterium]
LHIRRAADMPVLQISIQPHRDVRWHLALGKALAPLRRTGVAIMASGGAVHNVRDAMTRLHRGDSSVPDWAASFERDLSRLVAAGDANGIADLLITPAGRMSHPRNEHLLPLLVAMGAGGGMGEAMHRRFDCGSLAMTAYRFSGA